MNSVVIFGYNHLGSTIAKSLHALGHDIVVVDMNLKKCKKAQNDGFVVFNTDLSDDDELVDWGLGVGAHCLFCVSENEEFNLYLTLTAKTMDSSLFIIARSEDADSKTKLLLSGANHTIDIGEIGAQKIFSAINSPYAEMFIEGVLYKNSSFYHNEKIDITMLQIPTKSHLIGNDFSYFDKAKYCNIAVLAVVSLESGNTIYNVDFQEYKFCAGDSLVALGNQENIVKLVQAT